MEKAAYSSIGLEALAKQLGQGSPDNDDRRSGFALVNVLPPDEFERQRIPGSANIPQGREDHFEQRFDKQKEIIVYCASPECPASSSVASELAERGFEHVVDYEGGLSDWRDAGRPLAGSQAAAR